METLIDFLFLGSKITINCDCSLEIKTLLLLGSKAMANLDSVLKSRDITWPTKVHPVKAIVFPVAMYICMSWTIKKAECLRVDTVQKWTLVLEKTLESSLDSKETKSVNLKENHPWIFIGRTDMEAEAPVLWPPDAKSWLTGKDSDAGKDWGVGGEGGKKDRWLDSVPDSLDRSLSKLLKIAKDREACYAVVCGIAKGWTRLSDWTHSSILVWEIPWTKEPDNIQSLGLQKNWTLT